MLDWAVRARSRPEKVMQWCCHERREEKRLGQTPQNSMGTCEKGAMGRVQLVAPNAVQAQKRPWWRKKKRRRTMVTSERITVEFKLYLLVLDFSSEKLRSLDK